MKDKDGYTPLMFAVSGGDPVGDSYAYAPLMISAGYGNPEIVKLLLHAGAKVNARNVYGYTPLMFAASGGNPEIVKLLLDAGADVNAKTKVGRTALRYRFLVDLAIHQEQFNDRKIFG